MADTDTSDRTELQQEAPPSYNAATQDAPPSYEQLFGMGRMKKDVMEAKKTSSNKGIFAVRFCDIICGSVACMIGLILLAALPVAMIVIGSVYVHNCDGERFIPIWLIVFGVISLLQTLINIVKRCFKCIKRSRSDDDSENGNGDHSVRCGSCLESFLSFFLFVWIIAGSAWVFGFFDNYVDLDCRHNVDHPDCCHPVPFLFSFITLIVMYVFSFLALCCCCCCFMCLAFIAGAAAEE